MRRHFLLMITAAVCCVSVSGFAQEKKTTDLFNGKDLVGWDYFLVDDSAKMEDVWSVQDGILICKGEPMGFLATKKSYKNFKLLVEWRWAPGKKPGNSGVLLRITGKTMMLPRCVEAQLQSGNAGDIWAFQGFPVKTDTDRFRERDSEAIGHFVGVAKESGNEKEPGEWNEYEITMVGDKLKLEVNQKTVNECTGCDVVAGKVGFQSEGGEIHFKTIKILPLED